MLETKNISFQYPNSEKIVFPDLSLEKGKTLMICGESGSGKTTFLQLLAGLRKPSSGSVFIDKQDISSFSQSKLDQFRGKHIGIVYQQSYFIQSISILDNLLVSPYSEGNSKAQSVAKRLKIDGLLHRYAHQISVGQQQRASIARSVMNQPKLILADEPTSALDDANCKYVLELLQEEARLNEAALIIVTHDNRLKSEIDNTVELNPILNTLS